MCGRQRQWARLWSQPSGSLVISLIWWNTDALVKELHFQVTLSWREQGQESYLKTLWEGHALFIKNNNPFGEFVTLLELGGYQRKSIALLLRGMYCKPLRTLHIFCSTCLSSVGFFGPEQPHQQWDAFPPLLLTAGPTNLSFPGTLFPALSNIPWFLQTRGHCSLCSEWLCCKCCFQGCSEEAEKEVSWVLNSSQE